MSELPRIVLWYFGDPLFHLPSEEDDLRPTCRPLRIRGVPTMRTRVEEDGITYCRDCWPDIEV